MKNKRTFLLENKTLLVVDDDASNRMSIVNLLAVGFSSIHVFTANDGRQALRILSKKKVDLILLDWEMPIMNGLETLEALQADIVLSAIPVIMYTGAMTASSNLAKALEAGAVDFLRKPADPIELVARISSILYQKKLEEERLEVEQEFLQKEMLLLRQELTEKLLLLAHKNKMLLEIKATCKTDTQDATRLIRKIGRQLGKLVDGDDYWADFMAKFNKTDPNFVRLLLKQTPNLSPNEVRVCSLIRLGMSSKDIMNLINISIDGIKKSRYRIRKKINLPTSQRLEKYLIKI